jgi:SAM-dependent methyltransferase
VSQSTISIDEWVFDVRNFVNSRSPDLNSLLEVHIGEAKFGREFIDKNLDKLSFGDAILEVGAGSLLLSSQLMKEGYSVTALEPIGTGFSHFYQLQLLILELATKQNIKPNLICVHAENLNEDSKFDFAFSINVMEHVGNVKVTIQTITKSLKKDSTYRFTCPNYSFPYESHFNIPIFVNKKLTETLLKNRIYNKENMSDPKGVWESLNWITVGELKSIVKELGNADVYFDRNILKKALQRLISDTEFLSRRSRAFVVIAKIITSIRLHNAMQYLPMILQPLIDCSITKR